MVLRPWSVPTGRCLRYSQPIEVGRMRHWNLSAVAASSQPPTLTSNLNEPFRLTHTEVNMSKFVKALVIASALTLSAYGSASAAGTGAIAGLKAAAPQSTLVEVKGKGARNVGLGILGAAAAVAIIAGASNSAKADRRRDDDEDEGVSCGFLDRKCSNGHGWACRKFDRQCD